MNTPKWNASYLQIVRLALLLVACVVMTPSSAKSQPTVSPDTTCFQKWVQVQDMALIGNRAIVCEKYIGLELLDVSDPTNPEVLHRYQDYAGARSIARFDSLLMVGVYGYGIRGFRLTADDQLVAAPEYDIVGVGRTRLFANPPYLIAFNDDQTVWICELREDDLQLNYVLDFHDVPGVDGLVSANLVGDYLFLQTTYNPKLFRLEMDGTATEIELALSYDTESILGIYQNVLYTRTPWNHVDPTPQLRTYSLENPATPVFADSVEISLLNTFFSAANNHLYVKHRLPNSAQSIITLDATEPLHPVQTDTMTGFMYGPERLAQDGDKGILFYGDTQEVTFVEWNEDAGLELTGTYSGEWDIGSLRYYPPYLFVKNRADSGSWEVYDVQDMNHPVRVQVDEDYPFGGSKKYWNYMLKRDDDGTRLYNISDILHPRYVSTLPVLSAFDRYWWLSPDTLAIYNNVSMIMMDLSDPLHPDTITSAGFRNLVDARCTYTFDTNPGYSLIIKDWSDPHNPVQVRSRSLDDGYLESGYVNGNLVLFQTVEDTDDDMWGYPDVSWFKAKRYDDNGDEELLWSDYYDSIRNPFYCLGDYNRIILSNVEERNGIYQVDPVAGRLERLAFLSKNYTTSTYAFKEDVFFVSDHVGIDFYNLAGTVSSPETPASLISGATITLAPAYPNPFNAGTVITFSLPKAMLARVAIYDILGRQVCMLHDGPTSPGKQQLFWDGRSSARVPVASGVYLLQLNTEHESRVQRITVIK